ncbi:MAG: SGNH/GDSL hydrolase family protein [Sporichthyaceae bacterium]|nr:SGNH/GDSL hydrolase family protein [Sporichthyaceae bacterium]
MSVARRALLAVVLAVAAALPAAPAHAAERPRVMDALGDSITRGFNACGWFFDCTSRSWSAGSYSTVNSHYRRLAAVQPLSAYNDAKTGAKVSALPGQATTAVGRSAQYVTVLIGANDACTSTPEAVTSVPAFRASVRTALDTLASGGGRSVFVSSIPDLYQLWQVGKGSSSARSAWAAYGICQSMLKNPTSTQQADVDRRLFVQQRVKDYNAALAQECGVTPGCVYDGGAVFGYPFQRSHLSTWDYFHPNTSGQAVLSQVTWNVAGPAFGW